MNNTKSKSKLRAIGFSTVIVGVYLLNSVIVGAIYGVLLSMGFLGDSPNMDIYLENNAINFLATVSILSIIIFGIILYFKQKSSKNYSDKPFLGLEKVENDRIIESLILFLGTFGITFLWTGLIGILGEKNLFFEKLMEAHNDTLGNIMSGESFIFMFLTVAIIVPITEEMFFRGLIYGRLRQAMKPLVANLISSIIFGIFHGNVVQGVYAFFIGFILALVYEKTDCLLLPILGHTLINATGMALPMLELYNIYLAIAFMGIIALIPSIRIIKKWSTEKKEIDIGFIG